ncbi:aminodeoxychorismate/anthranilate synthase component II [Cellulomonas sp. APG4]|uniref:aminodeoxychorismate/anthranilate synthase component II n=1 Tax=Cellulomonas sp. APG4 TaxID=1538656 RepID=UPI001379F646|nr:aminodeoxychorismate/anthranilate synthase component II [Cellulomonas sp. APG4]NCT91445.1 aminodeoxychorismate/anthranilate synthase component II [Cellulomonas sp. APG4]
MTRILVVDNYDSFVYTIVGYLDQLGAQTVVVRNDAVPAADERAEYDGVLVSPGPGTPRAAGASMDVIRDCAQTGTPMLGVCLGHQALAEVYGATVTHAAELMHGKTSEVEHAGTGVLAGLASPFTATRYHSLAVVDGTVPLELVVTARTHHDADDGAPGVIMGVQHRELPLHGVQFHPESVLTEGGHRLLANWLEVCGLEGAVERSSGMHPLVRETPHA